MLRLLKYELYKIFSRKSIIAVFVLLLLMVLLSCIGSAKYVIDQNGDSEQFYNDFYKGKEGDITGLIKKEADDFFALLNNKDDNEDFDYNKAIKEQENKYGIRNFRGLEDYYRHVSDSSQFAEEFISNRIEVNTITQERLNKLGENSYDYKYAKLHSDLLSKQKPVGIFYDQVWRLLDTNNIYLIVVALILLGITPIFTSEYNLKTDSLILTSKLGRNSVITAKILASLIYSVAVTLFYNIVNLVTMGLALGFRGYNVAPASLFSFKNHCFDFTNLQHFVLQTVFMIFGAICLSMFVLFLSSLMKSQLVTFFIASFIVAFPTVYTTLSERLEFSEEIKHFFNAILYFTYNVLMKCDSLFKNFKAYNIFGVPILTFIVIPAFFLIITAIFVYLIYPTFKKHQVY